MSAFFKESARELREEGNVYMREFLADGSLQASSLKSIRRISSAENAIKMYNQAKQRSSEIGDKEEYLSCCKNLAFCHYKLASFPYYSENNSRDLVGYHFAESLSRFAEIFLHSTGIQEEKWLAKISEMFLSWKKISYHLWFLVPP